MSRHPRPDYHAYTQQTHARWSPSSPPINRMSNPVDPRLASRMGTTQDLQAQSTPLSQSSQISQNAAPIASTTGADIVQAIQAMNAQMTGQLSMMGTQLASLVSLTSRLIEISQLSTANANGSNNGTGNGNGQSANPNDPLSRTRQDSMATTDPSRAASAMSPDMPSNNARGRATNGSLADGVNVNLVNSSNAAARPDTRSGPFYGINTGYRGSDAASSSTLNRAAFGSTLRGASPSDSSPSALSQLANNSLASARGQPTAAEAADTHKSRLPSPVFVDDPIGMTTDPVSAPAQNNASLARRQTIGGSGGGGDTMTPNRTTDSNRSGNSGDTSASKKAAESTLGDWKAWTDYTWRPSASDHGRVVKYRTMQAARRAHKDMTKRSMATLGRLPLKEFLEIKPEQYLNVRKTGRKVYQEWLHQEVRLAKQPEDRLRAAINRIEHEHPALGDCDDHWKAKQLLQQIIDNAIDEANLHRKKEARASNAGDHSTNATPRSAAMNELDRNRGNSLHGDGARKGVGAAGAAGGSSKAPKAGARRKAEQAELDETPSRFRAPPAPLHAETTLLDSEPHTRVAEWTGMPDQTQSRGDAAQQQQQQQQQQQHPQQQQQQQQQWGAPAPATSTSSLFSQSSYAAQQPLNYSHGSHYLDSHHHGPSGPGAGAGTGVQSSLMEDRAHHHLVNGAGGVRLAPTAASATPNTFSFDYRHHA